MVAHVLSPSLLVCTISGNLIYHGNDGTYILSSMSKVPT